MYFFVALLRDGLSTLGSLRDHVIELLRFCWIFLSVSMWLFSESAPLAVLKNVGKGPFQRFAFRNPRVPARLSTVRLAGRGFEFEYSRVVDSKSDPRPEANHLYSEKRPRAKFVPCFSSSGLF